MTLAVTLLTVLVLALPLSATATSIPPGSGLTLPAGWSFVGSALLCGGARHCGHDVALIVLHGDDHTALDWRWSSFALSNLLLPIGLGPRGFGDWGDGDDSVRQHPKKHHKDKDHKRPGGHTRRDGTDGDDDADGGLPIVPIAFSGFGASDALSHGTIIAADTPTQGGAASAPVTAVPQPGTVMMLGGALMIGLWGIAWKARPRP